MQSEMLGNNKDNDLHLSLFKKLERCSSIPSDAFYLEEPKLPYVPLHNTDSGKKLIHHSLQLETGPAQPDGHGCSREAGNTPA